MLAPEPQYKGKRRQDFFNYWTPLGMRDKAVHAQLKRACYADRVTYVDPEVTFNPLRLDLADPASTNR